MAVIRTLQVITGTSEDLTFKFMMILPSSYTQVDMLAHVITKFKIIFRKNWSSWSSKAIVESIKSMTLKYFNMFLFNGGSKSTVIQLIFEVMGRNRVKVFDILWTNEVVLLTEKIRHSLTLSRTTEENHVYLQPKNQLDSSFLSWDITNWRILQSDWPRVFWLKTWEQEFC